MWILTESEDSNLMVLEHFKKMLAAISSLQIIMLIIELEDVSCKGFKNKSYHSNCNILRLYKSCLVCLLAL